MNNSLEIDNLFIVCSLTLGFIHFTVNKVFTQFDRNIVIVINAIKEMTIH